MQCGMFCMHRCEQSGGWESVMDSKRVGDSEVCHPPFVFLNYMVR